MIEETPMNAIQTHTPTPTKRIAANFAALAEYLAGHLFAKYGWTMREARDYAYGLVREHHAHAAMQKAITLLDDFFRDLETSNPGYLGQLVLQDSQQFNKAMSALSKAKAALAPANEEENAP